MDDSFVNYRKTSNSDDSSEILESTNSYDERDLDKIRNKDNRRISAFDVPETESESSEEEIEEEIIKFKRKQRENIVYSDTEDEEDKQFEQRAFSPSTRRSITGKFTKEMFTKDSEEESSESEEDDEYNSNSEDKADNNSEESQSETSKDLDNTNSSNSISIIDNSNLKSDTLESIKENNSSKTRFSTNFNSSISNKHSSTGCSDSPNLQNLEDSKSSTKILNSPNSDSFEILSFKEPIINISSESESSSLKSSTPNISEQQTPRSKNLVQTKLSSLIGTPSINRYRPQFVSPSYLEKELHQLEELRKELSICKNLSTVHQNLPDGGSKMIKRIEKLKVEIKERANKISNLIVDKNEVEKHEGVVLTTPSWDELNAANNAIQPKYTGKIGLAKFTAEKALTIDRLKDIHGSLETCPNESVLAEDPKGLNVPLMEHQKHALAFMRWRESQKPRGGILADDMGLGKTLTMISLIIDAKLRNNTSQNQESSEEESDGKINTWIAKGRKDYHNGGTLVVAPASLLKQWESEVENRTKRNLLSICVHHGNNRETKGRQLAKYDIVITTYNIVSREFKRLSSLFAVKWDRIILDEAHVIRNHKSQSSIAVHGLKGKYRWALTGTPIQNKETDLYAIIKFLKCSPFDDINHWKKWIDNKSAGGTQRLNTLIKSLLLRRTKIQLQQKGELTCLPDKDTQLIDVTLEKDEMNVYQKIMIYSRTLFAQFLHQRAEKENGLVYSAEGNRPTFMQAKDPNGAYYKMHQKVVRLHGKTDVKSHEILVLLLRLRQICCHPGLIDAMLEDDNNISTDDSSKEYSGTEIDLLDQLDKLQINDNSDKNNLSSFNNSDNSTVMSKASSKVLLKSNPVFDLNRISSKMKKILDVLDRIILNTTDKAIIVSQWTSVLNLLQTHLARKNIPCCCLNGTVPVKNRNNIVTNFNNEKSPEKVMLLSLTAGGVGLNLVGANHLFLIDLHWNPQLELQAQDRIYRVGQKKHVNIYKFMCKDTIEERIKALQDHKMAIAQHVLTGSKSEAGSKLTLDDLKSLFGL